LPLTLPQLAHLVEELRDELLTIVQLRSGPNNTAVYQTAIDIPEAINREALKRLARVGWRFYDRLFGSDPNGQVLGDGLRRLAQREHLKIQIRSQRFVLPWGVLYIADRFDENNVDPDLFLGLKHVIEQIPVQPALQAIDTLNIASEPPLTVGVQFDTDIDTEMRLPLIAEQRKYWGALGDARVLNLVERVDRDAVRAALADGTTADQLLYFYCHAASRSLSDPGGPGSSALVFKGGQRLTLDDLDVDAPRRIPLPGNPLVFINACETAELSPLFYDGFVPYFVAKGARGVIGTESLMPALFAREWATRFFDRFLTGESVGQIFLDLRREFYFEHNNLLGLLYALYCDGDTRIDPALQLPAAAVSPP
jgi:hypothetical protein